MNTQLAYCSACDQQVRIVVTPAPAHEGHANIPDAPEVVCLDFGDRCTGRFCPMFGLPHVLMGVRLARSELRPGGWKTVHALCDGCDQVTDMEVIDPNHAVCTVCHTSNKCAILELDDGSYIVIGRKAEQAEAP